MSWMSSSSISFPSTRVRRDNVVARPPTIVVVRPQHVVEERAIGVVKASAILVRPPFADPSPGKHAERRLASGRHDIHPCIASEADNGARHRSRRDAAIRTSAHRRPARDTAPAVVAAAHENPDFVMSRLMCCGPELNHLSTRGPSFRPCPERRNQHRLSQLAGSETNSAIGTLSRRRGEPVCPVRQ